jgi:hypothetical protein
VRARPGPAERRNGAASGAPPPAESIITLTDRTSVDEVHAPAEALTKVPLERPHVRT